MLLEPSQIKLPPLRLKLIEVVAQNCLTDAHITEPPVPIIQLLEEMAVEYFYNDDYERGFCFEKKLEQHVYIENKMSPDFHLYPLSRLLGHMKLGHPRFNQCDMTEIQFQKMNCEADYFADCLLMPADWLHFACPDGCVTFAEAQNLAQSYFVPPDIMNRRLRSLGIRIK